MNVRQRLAIVSLVVAIGLSGILSIALTNARAQTELAPPPVTAEAFYVVDATLGEVLYEANADNRRSPASLTKLATALVVMEQNPNMDDLLTVDQSDVLDIDDGQSMVGFVAGDVFTIREMLYGLLLNSGNDAAHALARYFGQRMLDAEGAVGDPVARFVQSMNDFAGATGLEGTRFANPEGLYDPNHYSTARDFSRIAALVLTNPILAETVGTAQYTMVSQGPTPTEYTLLNTNQILGEDGVIGLKTGTLSEAGACLVAAKPGPAGTMVISVVLGSDIAFDEFEIAIPSSDMRYDDTRALFSSMTADYRWIRPEDTATVPGLLDEMSVWQVGIDDDLPILLPAGDADDLQYLLRLGPPVDPGAVAGSLMLYQGTELVAETPVIQLPVAS